MTSLAIRPTSSLRPSRDTLVAGSALVLGGLVAAALARRVAGGGSLMPSHDVWLALHLLSVIPALPIGAFVMIRRKGDRLHKMLGRVWALLMVTAALSSFGLHSFTGHLSVIHLLSVITLTGIARGIWMAVRGDIARHRASMLRVYFGLISAGVFAFVPGRLLATWLFG